MHKLSTFKNFVLRKTHKTNILDGGIFDLPCKHFEKIVQKIIEKGHILDASHVFVA